MISYCAHLMNPMSCKKTLGDKKCRVQRFVRTFQRLVVGYRVLSGILLAYTPKLPKTKTMESNKGIITNSIIAGAMAISATGQAQKDTQTDLRSSDLIRPYHIQISEAALT